MSGFTARILKRLRGDPPVRTPEQQALAERLSSELALYHFPGCPFCLKVRRALRRLGITLEQRDVFRDADRRQELREQGGRVQVPCLRIEAGGEVRWLYESDAIIAYLRRRFEMFA